MASELTDLCSIADDRMEGTQEVAFDRSKKKRGICRRLLAARWFEKCDTKVMIFRRCSGQLCRPCLKESNVWSTKHGSRIAVHTSASAWWIESSSELVYAKCTTRKISRAENAPEPALSQRFSSQDQRRTLVVQNHVHPQLIGISKIGSFAKIAKRSISFTAITKSWRRVSNLITCLHLHQPSSPCSLDSPLLVLLRPPWPWDVAFNLPWLRRSREWWGATLFPLTNSGERETRACFHLRSGIFRYHCLWCTLLQF